MKREPVTYKWQRATTSRTDRPKLNRKGATMALYREIADGFDYFVSRRMKAAVMRKAQERIARVR